MGAERATSVVNPWLQSWDLHNVPVGALAYRAADAIVSRYLKKPGPLA